jgi:Na+-translocating ferredoxin:NAD+ oxidoreductase RNF subunit RnfB
MKQPREFFENAKNFNIVIYRSKSLCGCDGCIDFLPKGLILTTNEDINRMMDEQENGVEFDINPFHSEKELTAKEEGYVRIITSTRARENKSDNTFANKNILKQINLEKHK